MNTGRFRHQAVSIPIATGDFNETVLEIGGVFENTAELFDPLPFKTYLPLIIGPPPTLTGKVTDAVTGQPIEDAFVEARNLTTDEFYSAHTDANGNYGLSAPPGTYKVFFEDVDHDSQYYNNKPDFNTANTSPFQPEA